jgi:RNA-binding protein YhbY
VQAIKALGKEGVTSEMLKRLRLALSDKEKAALASEASHVTSWIYDVIKLIGKEN